MTKSALLEDITIRTKLRPGDLVYVIHRHGAVYAAEYGYGNSFESYVAAGLHEFHTNYNPVLDGVWLAEHASRIVGTLFLAHREPGVAQLRYFLIEPEYRGIGLGKRLMQLFCQALHERGYRSAFLWTTHELPAAAALYRRHGFELTVEKPSTAFGKPLIEQRYDLRSVTPA